MTYFVSSNDLFIKSQIGAAATGEPRDTSGNIISRERCDWPVADLIMLGTRKGDKASSVESGTEWELLIVLLDQPGDKCRDTTSPLSNSLSNFAFAHPTGHFPVVVM